MAKRDWKLRIGSLIVFAVPGTLLGTSCASDLRRSVVAAGLDFVESSAGDVLSTLFPLDQILDGQ
ncbi:MAG: hypothetical protein AAB341_03645 [Planctomycetota bacterium]